jgi:poly-gamma-glutamate capsule biosynthesis protein CapA/YwtB (metallophosphatase superfamily)
MEIQRSAKVFLCGDVMIGRGIDQILPHPSEPEIHEGVMRSAAGYVELSERLHGALQSPVPFHYVWGDCLDVLAQAAPDARIVNLETSVTTSDDWLPKGINYRMHPRNVPCLAAAGIQCCALANNHVLDWGREGLDETLRVLGCAGILTVGAGRDLAEARAPAMIELREAHRLVVLAFGTESSGIPDNWGAAPDRSGVNLLPDLSDQVIAEIALQVRGFKRAGDVVVASIHWGENWGYEVPASHQHFARALIDKAGVDIVHGHSSHHPQAIEVHRGHLILYGAGDFLNDYEGIESHGEYRGERRPMTPNGYVTCSRGRARRSASRSSLRRPASKPIPTWCFTGSRRRSPGNAQRPRRSGRRRFASVSPGSTRNVRSLSSRTLSIISSGVQPYSTTSW